MDNAARKKAAVEFLEAAATGKAMEIAKRLCAPDCKHHNPWFPAGMTALATAMDENARQNPEKRLDVKNVLAEGDLVAVHSRVRHKPDGPEAAVVHIFRFKGDKIVELWDVGQEAPKDSPNADGLF